MLLIVAVDGQFRQFITQGNPKAVNYRGLTPNRVYRTVVDAKSKRRLAAILAADVVGYSKLMAEDESGTLSALKAHRAELFDPETAKYGGRIVKLMGDGVLVEFPSIVDAVECAIAIQQALATEDGNIKLRIGINLGDIIIDGDDIYGDGVNLAARLEALSEPGGIAISGMVHEGLGNRVEASFSDGGEQQVKNIERPVHIYRWRPDGPAPEKPMGSPLLRPSVRQTIQIVPFENLSGDSDLGYFCKGIADEIATALANVTHVSVIAHRPETEKRARYILEGSVRKAGSRMRFSSQLIDAFSGEQVWAQRFERDSADMFDVQDDIVRNLIIALQTRLLSGTYASRWQEGTNDYEAWQLQAKGFYEYQKYSPESIAKAAALFDKALARDPNYVPASLAAAYCRAQLALIADDASKAQLLAKANAAFDAATARDLRDARPYTVKRMIEVAKGDYGAGVEAVRTAMRLEPNEPVIWSNFAFALLSAGDVEEALVQITRTNREIPNYPGWWGLIKALCLFFRGDAGPALDEVIEITRRTPDFYPGPVLAAAFLAEAGREMEASDMCRKVIEMDPKFSTATFVRFQGLGNPSHHEALQVALRKSGLPG